jgi:hypothetical protein
MPGRVGAPARQDFMTIRDNMTDITERDASRNIDFDIERSVCIVPAKTSALAYIDDRGDLWIHTSDSALHRDNELRIAADDVLDFIDGLTRLIGIPAVGEAEVSKKRTSAERTRRYRANRRGTGVTESVTGVTSEDQPVLDWSAG